VLGGWRQRAGHPEVVAALDHLGLADVADRRPDELSNGARHLVAIGRALVARPVVVCLDEPAAGLDTTETVALAEVVAGLVELGTSVLLVDHDMDLVFGVCHRVVVLDFGQVIATGTPDEVRADALVRQAYLGTHRPDPGEGRS
jgi:ABC-type branched-subunit amino acid transport system ATPase component